MSAPCCRNSLAIGESAVATACRWLWPGNRGSRDEGTGNMADEVQQQTVEGESLLGIRHEPEFAILEPQHKKLENIDGVGDGNVGHHEGEGLADRRAAIFVLVAPMTCRQTSCCPRTHASSTCVPC